MSALAPVVRALTVDDTDAIVDLATLCEIAENGESDPELVDWIVGGSGQPHFHAFGVDADEGLAAFGYVECMEGGSGLDAEVRVRPGTDLAVGVPVLAAVRRAAADFDGTKPVHLMANNAAAAYRRWLEQQGAREVRHFWRMAIDFDESSPSVPPAPAGLVVRRVRDDESDLQSVFQVIDTSFAAHFGHTDERTYEQWIDLWRRRQGFDLSLWWVVEDTGLAVAACLAMTFTDDDGVATGHIGTLGTLKEHRGRGVGTHLLLTAFREFHDRGLRRVTLGVDSENTTGAVRLYETIGMRAVSDWALYELAPYGPAGSSRSASNAT